MHIHVETDRRYEPIDYTMKYGTITKVAMENLVEQIEGSDGISGKSLELIEVQPGQIAVVAISPGRWDLPHLCQPWCSCHRSRRPDNEPKHRGNPALVRELAYG